MTSHKKRKIHEVSWTDTDGSDTEGTDEWLCNPNTKRTDNDESETEEIDEWCAEDSDKEMDSSESDSESSTVLSLRLKKFRENLKWCTNSTFQPTIYDFIDPRAGIQQDADLDTNSTPLEILKKFFTDEVIEIICCTTNIYAEEKVETLRKLKKLKKGSRILKYSNTYPDEMLTFFGLLLLMGIVRKPTVEMYWSKNQMLETPFFLK